MTKLALDTPLEVHEIDFRVQSINRGGYATILAYKSARTDYRRLNAIYGAGNWQRKHEMIGDRLYCSVGLWHKESNSWCWIQDVGTESNTEKEKGQASDSFKRSCFNLGIGNELYDYPVIQIKLKDDEWELKEWQGKQSPKATWKLKLREWTWYSVMDGHEVAYIACKDETNTLRFEYGIRPKKEDKK